MFRRLVRASWLLPLVALAVAGCERTQSSVPKQNPPPPAVTVAYPLKRMAAQEEEQVGRFVAVDSVDVRARVSGYLDAIHFRDGQIVQKGTPLFTIDRRPYEITVEQTRATLAQAEANLTFAEADLARAKDLVMGASITQQAMDQRVQARASARAAVMAQKAALRQAELDLEFTELKSPVTGRIGDRRVSVGNFVSSATGANSIVLAIIQSIDPIRFEFTLDESAFLRLTRSGVAKKDSANGLPVKLKLLDETDFAHQGRIDFIDNAISRSSGTIRGRAELANPKALFTPGMFARVRIAVSEPAEVLLVPDAAIGTEQARKLVMVVGDDNLPKPKYVKLGSIVDGLRVIEDGIRVSDRVVIDGLMRVRPGSPVTPTPGTITVSAAAPVRADN
jgi:RND family efflux transporter MFP subunit